MGNKGVFFGGGCMGDKAMRMKKKFAAGITIANGIKAKE